MAKVWIPADRFLAVLDRCNIGNEDLDKAGVRRLWDLRNGRQEAISLEAADRILTKLGLVEWWHTPKENGGLADLYFGDDVFVPEWVPKAKAQLDLTRPARKKYHTQEERMEGARAKSRRSARRLGNRCKCGTQITNKATTCKPCFLAELPEPAHGTNSRYASAEYRCRCDLCRAASSTYHRDRRRRVKAEYLDAQAAACASGSGPRISPCTAWASSPWFGWRHDLWVPEVRAVRRLHGTRQARPDIFPGRSRVVAGSGRVRRSRHLPVQPLPLAVGQLMSANDQGRLDLPAPASRQELVQRLQEARIESRKNWGVYVEMQAQVRRQMGAGTERLIADVYRRHEGWTP